MHDATTRPANLLATPALRPLAVIGVLALVAACARSRPETAAAVVPPAWGGGPSVGAQTPAPAALPQTQADVDLARHVAQSILDEPAAEGADVTLSVHDGVVRLEGVAPDLATHAAVLSAVWSVEGVRGVVDRLGTSSVAPPSNLSIALAVRDAFAGDPLLRDLPLAVAVEGSVVRLSGAVPDVTLRGRAEAIARTVRGVRDVVNDLHVAPRR